MPVDLQNILFRHTRDIDPEKLAMLQRVFDKVCREAGIFHDATDEREELVVHILRAATTEPIEELLVDEGHYAVAQFRRNARRGISVQESPRPFSRGKFTFASISHDVHRRSFHGASPLNSIISRPFSPTDGPNIATMCASQSLTSD